MKRWFAVATVVATILAVGGLAVGPAMAATPRGTITINGNSDLDSGHGVTNTPCGTGSLPACSIDNWEITPAAGATCITIKNVDHPFVVRDNSCSGGTNGIVVTNSDHGKVLNNAISNLSGTATLLDATGISFAGCTDMAANGNQLSKIQGNQGVGAGASGGSGVGISVTQSNPMEIESNSIDRVSGGFGILGSSPGGKGGDGGMAIGITVQKMASFPSPTSIAVGPASVHLGSPIADLLESVLSVLRPMIPGVLPPAPPPDSLTVKQNTISRMTGAVGAIGASGGTGTGGAGGKGGGATGVSVTAPSGSPYVKVAVTGNNISTVIAGVGAIGGSGRNGGNGGSGGSATGVALTYVGSTGSSVTGSTITQLYGAVGAIGGTGTFGVGTGGRGGDGGNAIGILRTGGTVNPGLNTITFFFAGLAGNGGFPGGTRGTNGTAAAVRFS